MEEGAGQEGQGGCASVFLDMDEGAGELDEAFEEFVGGGAALAEPKRFEGVVGFEEPAGIEVGEEGLVIGRRVGVWERAVGGRNVVRTHDWEER
jgi:hypothetical protein